MSKYSELADRLEHNPAVNVLEMELFRSAATALRELEAENERLRKQLQDADREWYSKLEAADARIAELEAVERAARELMEGQWGADYDKTGSTAAYVRAENNLRTALAALEGE